MKYQSLTIAIIAIILSQQVFGGDFATEVIQATFKLFHPDSTSTCFLVQREEPDKAYYLVTTGHSLERSKGETVVLVLREQKADGTIVRYDHKISIRNGEIPLWTRHPKEDVAVLRLAEQLPVAVSALPFTDIADEKRLQVETLNTCSSVFILTFPQRFEANISGFPIARQGIIADHPFLSSKSNSRFLVDFTTFAGDSGGPVFVRTKDGRPLIIGMVLAQFRHDEKVKMEYEERTIHHPLGLGAVLYPQFIRETIEIAVASQAEPVAGGDSTR